MTLRHTPDWMDITVADTGVGMEPALLATIFEPFRQGASKAGGEGGLGLGLAIVRELVRAHGGEVQAASPGVGAGTTFTVHLPMRPL